ARLSLATLFLQAITGAHTLTCLLSRNRSRRNRDAPIVPHPHSCSGCPGASRARLARAANFYSTPNPVFKLGRSSFRSQRFHRIDGCCPPRRNVARDERNGGKEQGNSREGKRVSRLDA